MIPGPVRLPIETVNENDVGNRLVAGWNEDFVDTYFVQLSFLVMSFLLARLRFRNR